MNAADWPRQARAFVALNEHWRAAGVGPWRYVALDAAHPLSCFCEGYLAWERHFRPRRGAMSAADDVGADDADDAAAARRPAEDAVEFEYHILPSSAYGTPELRLRACDAAGAPLALDALRAELDGAVIASWDEHPVTGARFALLHGCCDGERAEGLGDASLLAWFVGLAPALGLRVPPDRWRRLEEIFSCGCGRGCG
mmetsp:Transcript_25985/g.77995  ORF Transcript_25985/g.77995 Transcript_25985/m.77995 type:complete len:198 (-) Transcript_25985:32-625(-)